MHLLGDREKGSKVYPSNIQSIAMNTDKSHQKITESKIQEAVYIQEKKRIDKILQSIVKERLFGNFISEDGRLSKQNVYNIDMIYKTTIAPDHKYSETVSLRSQKSRQLRHYEIKSSCTHHTIDVISDKKYMFSEQLEKNVKNRRNLSQKLPQIVKTQQRRKQSMNQKGPIFHNKKLQINQKILSQFFKKFLTNNPGNAILYDLKITRQSIINKYKHLIDGKLLQRFFHFFSFPQTFGMRQYCNLVESAANCNLKFIYFFVFSLFDEIANGVLTSQDFFKFLQRFYIENQYIEKQVYKIQRYLDIMQKNFKPREQKESETPIQQILVINHNIKLQEMIVLMKQSNKEIIDVECLKNTCYHQSLLSLEHDPLERLKKKQIQSNEEETNRLKEEANLAKERLKNTPGLRLRDFYAIYDQKRPKIFCYFLHLLTNIKPTQYQ